MYLGLSADEWNKLADRAEEIFTDNNIGQYLLGLYPAGDRIFGRRERPSLLCLYLEDPITLLDPIKPIKIDNYQQKIGRHFIFYNFFEWLRNTIVHQVDFSLPEKIINSIIPCEGEAIYENEAISEILALLRTFLISKKYNISKSNILYRYPMKEIQEGTKICFQIRTLIILLAESKFLPSVNEDWGTVFLLEESSLLKNILDNEIFDIDNKLLTGSISIEEINLYLNSLIDAKNIIIDVKQDTEYQNKICSEISKVSIEYLRYLI